MPTNENDKLHGRSDEQPGYETTDVNVSGVVVFLGGLSGFVLIFFLFCFGMGKVINNALEKNDGPVTKWNERSSFAGAATTGGKRQDLATDPEIRQKALQQMTSTFPTPRLDIDDGNQATADLHAREDLLLDHYSSAGQQRTIRIPIEQAMEAIAKKGLPVATQSSAQQRQLAEDVKPEVQVPLTTGFARTGYELDVMEARAQKMNYGKAEGAEHAELKGEK
ncbi:hypothetical protein [Granulicella arctica]|uniref:hypothetical protein n=1 Tax=Granulicella arctica TaxID=940613 RepID=UPI0021DFD036|nr:hypothetical protein [Granulicella arctica]